MSSLCPIPSAKAHGRSDMDLTPIGPERNLASGRRTPRDLEAFVRLCMRQQGVPVRLFEKPVSISFWHNTRMDVDNHAAIEKMTVDALKGWLLRNDDRRHYREKHSFFHDENYMRVVISDEA